MIALDTESLLHDVIAMARQAGLAIMDIYHSEEIQALDKADRSPLTAADIASHQALQAGLRSLTPEIPVLSEESEAIAYEQRRDWGRFWLVDPLDGTKEFLKRNGEFTVNIALIEAGEPVLGVVYAPVLDVVYYAARGVGSFVQREGQDAQRIGVVMPRAGETVRVVASRSHSDERTTSFLETLGAYECISMGSSLKLCLVAEGKAHLYPRLGPTMEWDTAAAHAVVNEAGGQVVDWQGQPLRYNKPDLHNPEFLVCSNQYDGLADKSKAGVA